jgi:hypothetical protein
VTERWKPTSRDVTSTVAARESTFAATCRDKSESSRGAETAGVSQREVQEELDRLKRRELRAGQSRAHYRQQKHEANAFHQG